MYLNPIAFISRFFVSRFVMLISVPAVFRVIAPAGFTTISFLVKSVGLIPVLRCLLVFKKFLKNMVGKSNFNAAAVLVAQATLEEMLRSANVNPLVSRVFIDYIAPYLKDFIEYQSFVTKWFWWFFTGVTLTAVRRLLFYGLKSCLGLLLGSVGVLLNDSLSSIPFLKEWALYFVEGFENLTDFKILKSHTDVVITPNNLEDEIQGYNWFTIAGLALIGLVASFLLFCATDYYAHESIKELPVLGRVSDSMHGVWDSITNWYHNWGKGPAGPDAPEAMSRSNSGGSNSSTSSVSSTGTVRPNPPTPPFLNNPRGLETWTVKILPTVPWPHPWTKWTHLTHKFLF